MKTIIRRGRRRAGRDRHAYGVRRGATFEHLEPRLMLSAVNVSTINDVSDGTTTSIANLIASPGVDGVISLREAIDAANNTLGADTIGFAIPGAGVHTITPATPLPTINDSVTIDGYTQTGASANTLAVGDNAVLLIELNGFDAGGSGLVLAAGSSTVRGLVINRWGSAFDDAGVFIHSDDNVVAGNIIGLDPSGVTERGNFTGVRVATGANNLIGGTTPAARNIMAGNGAGQSSLGSVVVNKIFLSADAEPLGTLIRGNYIGTGLGGTFAVHNQQFGNNTGIVIQESTGTIIGGTDADDGLVDGNVGARNVISGNLEGILTNEQGTTYAANLTIQGNFIGVDATGNVALGNFSNGITFAPQRDRADNFITIGGTAAGAGNVISGNAGDGVSIVNSNVTMQGNRIGTDLAGTLDLGNGFFGVEMTRGGSPPFPSVDFIVGGNTAAARNIISGNGGSGMRLNNLQGSVTVQGNFIGTKGDGVTALPNAGDGLFLQNSTGPTTIGGTGAGEGNVIAFNSGTGVRVDSATAVPILGNNIFFNSGLGIDLGADGITANDTGDADTGANNRQNFPVITSITLNSGVPTVQGTLNSIAGATFHIEIFASTAADVSNFGEGQTFLGSVSVTDGNSDGNVSFQFTASGTVAAGSFYTATATDTDTSDTSEFSLAVEQVVTHGVWDGGGDGTTWSDAANWSADALPGASDDVVIDIPATVVFDSSAGTVTVHSLTSSQPLDVSGGTLAVTTTATLTGPLSVSGGTIKNGTWDGTDTTMTASDGTLDGITISSKLTITGATVIKNGLTLNNAILLDSGVNVSFEGTQTLGGTGRFAFGGTALGGLFIDNGTLTIGANVQVDGTQNGNIFNTTDGDRLILLGRIVTDDPNSNLGIILTGSSSRFTNNGVLSAEGGGGIIVSAPYDGSGALVSDATGAMSFFVDLVGSSTDNTLFSPLGVTELIGDGTALNPQLLEAMSADLGSVIEGFSGNFDYGILSIAPGNRVKLVDLSNNAAGAGAEAVYVNTLALPAGTTLDLNGLNLYAKAAQLNGTVLNGTVTIIGAPTGPTVSIAVTDAAASEAGDTASYTVTRAGDTTDPLDVLLGTSGSAVLGTNYTLSDGTNDITTTVTIPAGQSSVDLTLTPIDDSDDNADRTATVTLQANASAYTLDSVNNTAAATIADNDPLSTVFSNADFTGTWNDGTLHGFGTVVSNGAGGITGGAFSSMGDDGSGNPAFSTLTTTGATYTVDAGGAMTMHVTTDSPNAPFDDFNLVGAMNSTKDFAALNFVSAQDVDGFPEEGLTGLIRSAGVPVNADLAGNWAFSGLTVRGTFTLNASGKITTGTFSTTDRAGNLVVTGASASSCTIDSETGLVTIHLTVPSAVAGQPPQQFDFTGPLNVSKDILGLTADPLGFDGNTDSELIVAVKQGTDYSPADLLGTFNLDGEKVRGHITFDGAGHFNGHVDVSVNENPQTVSGTYTIGSSGADAGRITFNATSIDDVTGVQDTSSFVGGLNASKNVVSFSRSDTPGSGKRPQLDLLVRSVQQVFTDTDVLGANGAKSIRFTEADGTLVNMTLSAGTAIVVFGGQNLQVTHSAAGDTVTGTNVTIHTVALSDTTTKSILSITAKGGDNLATAEDITGDAPLGSILAPGLDLDGAGIVLTGAATTVNTIKLHNLESGADVIVPGTTLALGSAFTASRLDSNSDVTFGSGFKSFTVGEWFEGTLTAPFIAKLTTIKNAALNVDGDFDAAVTLSGVGAPKGMTLGSTKIAGFLGSGDPLNPAAWDITGNSGAISAPTVSGWALTMHSNLASLKLGRVDNAVLNVAGNIGGITAVEWLAGSIAAATVKSLTIAGSKTVPVAGDFGADVGVEGSADPKIKLALGAVKVAGTITGGAWGVALGDIGAIAAGSTAAGWTVTADNSSIASITTLHNASGTLTAKRIATMTVKGDLTGADIHLLQAVDPKINAITSLSVTGQMLNSSLRSVGNIATAKLGAMRQSKLFAGVLDSITALPVDKADFDLFSNAAIKSLTVSGIKTDPNPAFDGSEIAAPEFGTINVLTVANTNTATPFGLAAHHFIQIAFKKDGVAKTAKTPDDVLALGLPAAGDDFDVRII